MATERTNILGMALISLGISVTLLIVTSMFTLSQAPIKVQNQYAVDYIVSNTLGKNDVTKYAQQTAPNNLACDPYETDCTGINAKGSVTNTGFDPWQTFINIAKVLGTIIQIVGLSILAPSVIGIQLTHGAWAITNPIGVWIVGTFCAMWQILNVWLYAMLLFRK